MVAAGQDALRRYCFCAIYGGNLSTALKIEIIVLFALFRWGVCGGYFGIVDKNKNFGICVTSI